MITVDYGRESLAVNYVIKILGGGGPSILMYINVYVYFGFFM